MFDQLPVDTGFTRTEIAGNAGLGVSGLDMTLQVKNMVGFKPTDMADMPDTFMFYSFMQIQIIFKFCLESTKITVYQLALVLIFS